MSIMPPIRHKRNYWEYSEIALIATEVAVDVDNEIIGRNTDQGAAQKLYDWLNKWVSDDKVSLFDTETQILMRLWSEKFEGRNITEREAVAEMKEEVKEKLDQILRFFSDRLFLAPLTKEDLESLRKFTLDLSTAALVESQEREVYF